MEENRIDELSTIQMQLDVRYEELNAAVFKLKLECDSECEPLFAARQEILDKMESFWPVVFQNHPKMSSKMAEDDKELVRSLKTLAVKQLGQSPDCFVLTMEFAENRFFRNQIVVKEVRHDTVCSPVFMDWHDGIEEDVKSKRPYFLTWLGREFCLNYQDSPDTIIKDEMWRDPLMYYLGPKSFERSFYSTSSDSLTDDLSISGDKSDKKLDSDEEE